MAIAMRTANGRTSQEAFEEMEGLFLDKNVLKEMVETITNHVLEAEVARHLGVEWHERSEGRTGHRNGYKPRTMKTRVGELELRVPQVREGGFTPTLFERYQRSEKALLMTMQEMFVKGVSTRDVTDVLEKMGGFSVSAGLVSRAATELDDQVRRWRDRKLNDHVYPYLMIDARYESVRCNHRIIKMAVLIVVGVTEEGRRDDVGRCVFRPENTGSQRCGTGDQRRARGDSQSGVEAFFRVQPGNVVRFISFGNC